MQACWRNAFLQGDFLDTLATDPLLLDLPRAGILSLDFVSYDVPSLPNAELLCKLAVPRARAFRVKPEPGPHMAAAADSALEGATDCTADVADGVQMATGAKGEAGKKRGSGAAKRGGKGGNDRAATGAIITHSVFRERSLLDRCIWSVAVNLIATAAPQR